MHVPDAMCLFLFPQTWKRRLHGMLAARPPFAHHQSVHYLLTSYYYHPPGRQSPQSTILHHAFSSTLLCLPSFINHAALSCPAYICSDDDLLIHRPRHSSNGSFLANAHTSHTLKSIATRVLSQTR